MNRLVKFIKNDDGVSQEPLWHLVDPNNGAGDAKICTGEFFDGATDVVSEEKVTERGGINCKDCISAIKNIKAVKL